MTPLQETASQAKMTPLADIALLPDRRGPERLFEKIIQQLKMLRLENGLSHTDLARRMGVTRLAISHIESGKRKPSLMMALKFAMALKTNLSTVVRAAEESDR